MNRSEYSPIPSSVLRACPPAFRSRATAPLRRAALCLLCWTIIAPPVAADFDELTADDDTEVLAQSSVPSGEEQARESGKALEDAAEDGAEEAAEKAAEEAVEEAGRKIEEAARELGDGAAEALEKAGDALADALNPDGFPEFRAGGAVFRYAPTIRNEVGNLQERITRGLVLIQSELESPGLPRAPQFWLVADEAELSALLQKRYPEMKPAALQSAMSARAYVKADSYYLVYPSRIARDRLVRLIYNEYALLHLNVLAAGGPEKRIAWFHSGMAAYFAWISEAELNGTGIKDVEKKMIRYYGRNFDPAKARSLKRLENPAAWATAIRADHKGVYAQAALVWMYLVRRSSMSTGPLVLRSMSTGESFADAFLNATDLRLGEFERDVREKFYPELKAASEAADAAAREARKKAEAESAAKQATETAADEAPAKAEPPSDNAASKTPEAESDAPNDTKNETQPAAQPGEPAEKQAGGSSRSKRNRR